MNDNYCDTCPDCLKTKFKGKLIGFMAKKHGGKDTSASHLSDVYGFKTLKFADPLKKACKAMFNFTSEQLEITKETIDPRWKITPRHAFQFVGTELVRNHIDELIPGIGADFWVKNMEMRIRKLRSVNSNVNISISDVRFQNEVNMILRLGGIIIKIERPLSGTEKDNHPSEVFMDQIENYDQLIINDGTIYDLFQKVDNVLEKYP